jgi:hypothetical protein|tara:strand:+ start:2246 stop:2458 length:213 start_codon:yes stop_codon:yes gene_type:complete
MLGLLWALNPGRVSEIYNMVIARAVGLKDTDAPILPLSTLPVVLILVHIAGYLLFKFVEVPALILLTQAR